MSDNFGYFRILNGEKQGEKYSIHDNMIIGRGHDCNVMIPDLSVSNKHFKVLITKQNVEVVDLNSKNGTRVNNRSVSSTVLQSGDQIEIGETKLIYEGGPVVKKKRSLRLILYSSVAFVVIFIVLIAICSRDGKKTEFNKAVAQGQEYFNAGQYVEAVEKFQYALSLDPNDEDVQNLLAQAEKNKEIKDKLYMVTKRYLPDNDLDSAIAILNEILKIDPENREAKELLQEVYRSRDMTTKIIALDSLINLGKVDEAFAILETFYFQMNDSLRKVELISKLLDEIEKIEKKSRDAANKYFQKILVYDPNNQRAIIGSKRTSAIPDPVKPYTSPPDTKIDKPTPLPAETCSMDQQKQAGIFFFRALAYERDSLNNEKAREFYRKVFEVCPDSNCKYYKDAAERLINLK